MKIIVNGKTQQFDEEKLSIKEILQKNDVKIDMVSVQLNGNFIKKEKYAETYVKDNNTLDFLYFMGGGAQIELIN